ncbi:MAG: Abi-alpha family protein [Pseudomonadota bacterium]
MTEETEAIKEVAKTAGKAIAASEKMVGFFDRVFGDLLENSVGLLSDKLKYYRSEKLLLLHEKTKKKLEDAGVDFPDPVLPKIGIPLIENATIEDDDSLHTKWANMLANAMNPEYREEIKRSYVSILSEIDPLDALILDTITIQHQKAELEGTELGLFDRSKICSNLNIDLKDCELSLRNLMRLGCITPGVVTGAISMGDHRVASYKDTELFSLTELGLSFHKAVS